MKGIDYDETKDFDVIRACGFTDFRVDDDEMHYEDEENYQEWLNERIEAIENVTTEYLIGLEDGHVYLFSDKENAIAKIAEEFPGCKIKEVPDSELKNYSFDYDYRRDGI